MTPSSARPRATRRKPAVPPPIPDQALLNTAQIQTLLEQNQTLLAALDQATAAIEEQGQRTTRLMDVVGEKHELIRRFALQLLGAGPGASPQERRSAYRVQAKQHHPDAGGDAEAFALLQLALQLLEQPQA